jgi:2-keto-3-deoxy-L-rhamnonate aldolase RhmA
VPPRAEIESPDAARYYLDLGVRHFSIGTDLMVVHRWMRENGENLRKVISEQ